MRTRQFTQIVIADNYSNPVTTLWSGGEDVGLFTHLCNDHLPDVYYILSCVITCIVWLCIKKKDGCK